MNEITAAYTEMRRLGFVLLDAADERSIEAIQELNRYTEKLLFAARANEEKDQKEN